MSMVFYFVWNMCMSWFNYHSIPWVNGNLASAEKRSGPLRFRLRQVLLYMGYNNWALVTEFRPPLPQGRWKNGPAYTSPTPCHFPSRSNQKRGLIFSFLSTKRSYLDYTTRMLTEVRISWFVLKCVAKEDAEGERLKMFIFSQTLTVPCIHKNWARYPGNTLCGANFESIGSQNVRCWYLEWHLTGSEPKLKLNFPTPDTVFSHKSLS
jgi:hypothetical protein